MNPADGRFCTGCGAPLAVAAAPASPAPERTAPPAAPRPRTAAAPAHASGAPAAAAPGGGVDSILRPIQSERTGFLGAAFVFGVGVVLSYVLWPLLRMPAQVLGTFVPKGNCMSEIPGSFGMYVCSSKVGFLTVAAPIAILVAIIMARGTIRALVNRWTARLPPHLRFVVAPLVGTLVFALTWAGIHQDATYTSGLMSQKAFPAVIGVFTYSTSRWRGTLQAWLAPAFDFRDRFPRWLRYVIALAIPSVIALVITYQERVSGEVTKEQLIVLVSLATTYIALAPRQGGMPKLEAVLRPEAAA